MKKIILFASLAILLCACYEKNDVTFSSKKQITNILIKGSETVKPIIVSASQSFVKSYVKYKFEIDCKGSSDGINSLIEGKTDIALSSRELKEDEINKLNENGERSHSNMIGLDALSIIVNPPTGEHLECVTFYIFLHILHSINKSPFSFS